MRVRILGMWVLGILIAVQSFDQRIVDQTSINPFEPVTLFDPLSLLAFSPSITEGSEFPDFQTISTENEVFDLNGILLDAIEEQKVPILAFGRPSCNQLRDIYQHIFLPVIDNLDEDVSVFHLANSIESHATNGYLTPYFAFIEGQVFPAPQIPSANQGYEFHQPFTGDQLVTLSQGFVDKMVETEVGEEEDFEDITILLDSPDGGFTGAFSGSAIIWVLNPFNSTVVYETVDLICSESDEGGCGTEQRQEMIDAIHEVKQMYSVVGIQDEPHQELIEVENFNILGQHSRSGLRLFYHPITKEKILKPAQ